MYFLFAFLLLFVLFGFLFFHKRKKNICKKICSMTTCEKIEKINELIMPFGYCYYPNQDIFSTTIDAWQREFGYTESYNYHSQRLNIVFDNQPIYFDYNNRTWLIEFWKGQYGINAGGEVGIYYSDSIVPHYLRNITLFKSVKDNEMFPISMQIFNNGNSIGKLYQKHWWLTIFKLGMFCEPSNLSMKISITFPNCEMMNVFINALYENGYQSENIYISGLRVYILFNSCSSCSLSSFRRLSYCFTQWKNRNYCKLYLRITKPFSTSLDRALCLYYYLPFAFRRLFTLRKFNKCKKCRKFKESNKCCKYKRCRKNEKNTNNAKNTGCE